MSGAAVKQVHVSVVVAIYNAERFLRQCLQSLAAIEYPAGRFEVICVDNASTDSSPEILREYGSAFRLTHETTRGPGAARNAGIRAASGTFVAFTDADCMVQPQWLLHLLAPLERGTSEVSGGRILARPGAGTIERFGEVVHDHAFAIGCCRPPYLIGMNFALRRALMREIGCFDQRWLRSEDSELSFRLLRAGCSFAYAPDAVVFHHHRSSLRQLCREGFLHGYYGAELFRVYDRFVKQYQRDNRDIPEAQPVDVPPAASSVPGWQLRAMGNAFRAAKWFGWRVGSWRPPGSLRDPS